MFVRVLHHGAFDAFFVTKYMIDSVSVLCALETKVVLYSQSVVFDIEDVSYGLCCLGLLYPSFFFIYLPLDLSCTSSGTSVSPTPSKYLVV